MKDTTSKTDLDWAGIIGQLNEKGYSRVASVISPDICKELIASYENHELFRKTVIMERHRYGLGEYKYFDHPLPDFIERTRNAVYPKLAPLANEWAEKLKLDIRYPHDLESFRRVCSAYGQTKPTPLILKYGKGGFNTLHQDLYGEIYFPIQLAFFLNEPDKEYTGGEFVFTQQIPRAQSKAIVLRPRKGDMIAFSTNFRPVKGVRGYYRSVMKHGVSEILSGERYTLGIIFHDAVS